MGNRMDIQQLQHYSKLELIAKQVVEGFITGLHKSPFHGFSVEFAEHRFYNPGEPTRHIDWKLYGRTEKLFLKRYEEETNLRCQLVLDASSSMYYPEADVGSDKFSKLKFSVYAAAAIMVLLQKQRDAAGMSIFSDKIHVHTPAKSSIVHHRYLMNELEQLLEASKRSVSTDAIASLHTIADTIHKRSLVIVFSDMMEDMTDYDKMLEAMQHLKHNKHEVVLFHTADYATEMQFDFENKPYQFIDIETEEVVKLHPNEVKEYYVSQMRLRKRDLRLKCGQLGIDYVEVDVNEGFNEVLQSYLLKRKKMM